MIYGEKIIAGVSVDKVEGMNRSSKGQAATIDYDFESIYRSHKDAVRRIVGRLLPWDDLDDAVQEVFAKVYLSLGQFSGDAKLETWIYRIAVNTAYDFNRKRSRLTNLVQSWLEKMPPKSSHSVEESVAIQDIVWKLPFNDRVVTVLFYVEGYQLDEIATLLEIPKGTVKSRLHNARRKLTQSLKEGPVDE